MKEAERLKYELLKRCLEEVNRREREKAQETLRTEAFKILIDHPHVSLFGWYWYLWERCEDLLVEAFGRNPANINNSIVKLWRSPYYDKERGWTYTYEQWSEKMELNL